MGEKEKVTIMVLKVDLQCHKCYKKVKKVLCKFPQIRDQLYNEKQNQVVIKVVCCSPEKIRDKICCKGGSAIKSIEIMKEPDVKPKGDGKGDGKGDSKPKDDGKPKDDSKPKDDGKPNPGPPLPQPVPCVPAHRPPVRTCCMECYQGHAGGPCHNPGPPPPQPVPCVPAHRPPVRACCMDCYQGHAGGPCHNPGPPPPQPVPCVPRYRPPVRACCMDCYQGRAGGPCHSGYGGGPAPYIQYDGYYGRPVYDSYGGGSMGYCVTRPDYFSEENTSACRVM